MKKIIFSLFVYAALFLSGRMFAQVATASPSTFCYNSAGNNGTAWVNSIPAWSTSETWVVLSPPGPGNSATFSLLPPSPTMPSVIDASYTGCGIFTVMCIFYNGNTASLTAIQTVTVDCLTITPSTQTVCSLSPATLTAGGANSYTWSNGPNPAVNTVTPQFTAIYSVTGDINPSCVATATVNVLTLSITPTSTAACAGNSVMLTASGGNPLSYTWTSNNTAIAITASVLVSPGTYTVFSPSTNGVCQASINIGLAPPLNILTAQSSVTTCIANNAPKFSNPIVLSATGASNYVWFPPQPNPPTGSSVTVRPSVSTCYTVVGTTAICSGSAVACVTVIPQFTASTATNPQLVCYGADVSLGVSGIGTPTTGPLSSFTYSWDYTPLTTSVSSIFGQSITLFQVAGPIAYTVEVMDAMNCVSQPLQGLVTPNICNGLKTIDRNADFFNVFPNPAQDQLWIQADNGVNATALQLTIRDLLGRLVMQLPPHYITDGVFRVNASDLRNGVYYYTIRNGQRILQTGKLVKTD